jgi:hypothetical protein
MMEGVIPTENDSTLSAPEGSTTTPGVVEPHSSDGDLYHGISDAAAEGAAVVAGLGSGVLSTIDAGVRTLESTAKFKGDIDAIDAFLGPLVEAKILSPSEARLRLASPKLSRLCKIGEYAERLRHQDMIRYFFETGCSGHTLVYQAAVLLDQIPADQGEEERIQQLVNTLRRGQVETRQDMLRLTRELKNEAKRALNDDDAIPNSVEKQPLENHSAEKAALENPAADIGRRYDLVLAAPRPSHLRKLNEYYMETADQLDQLPRCLFDDDLSDDAVLVAAAELSDLPVIIDKLFPRCGFADVPFQVMLTHSPAGPDVTHARVMIVAERGSANRARLSDFAWNTGGDGSDLVTLADRLMPHARNKLNLFESKTIDGWFSLGPENERSQADE